MIQKLSDFERVICLCLDKRIDRFYSLQQQWRDIGIEVEPFITGEGIILPHEQYNLIDPPFNLTGKQKFQHNTLAIMEKMQAEGVKNFLSLEDDCEIKEGLPELFEKAMSYFKTNAVRWDVLYLGANHTWAQTEDINEGLIRCRGGTLTTHAVAYNLEHCDILDHILHLPRLQSGELDLTLSRTIQLTHHCYALWPNLAIQGSGYSYLVEADQDYEQYFLSKGSPWKK